MWAATGEQAFFVPIEQQEICLSVRAVVAAGVQAYGRRKLYSRFANSKDF